MNPFAYFQPWPMWRKPELKRTNFSLPPAGRD